jgi:hypothetical protein
MSIFNFPKKLSEKKTETFPTREGNFSDHFFNTSLHDVVPLKIFLNYIYIKST